ncbi:MAG: response regulator [Methanolobus sp.]|nr:response regulator [Methanolobus sp.]
MANILVVEDDLMNMELLTALLEITGHKVEGVDNGEKALNSVDKSHFDLILLDMRLPGMNGLEVVKKLRNYPQTLNVPVVAVTASAMKGDRESILEAGCADYVSKPFDTGNFLKVISSYL